MEISETLLDSSNSLTEQISQILTYWCKPSELFAKYDAPDLWMDIVNLVSLLEAGLVAAKTEMKANIQTSMQSL